jgi:hypothetical protein
MAKVQLNTALSSLSGRMDNWVYRRTRRGTSVAKRPFVSGIATAGQLAVRERFRLASAYAKSALLDPALRSRYEAAARIRDLAPYPFALADYLTLPVVDAIDASGYHGRVGDVIKVAAFDDFEVTGVTVAVRDGEGAILMQGTAVLQDGRWSYAATAAVQVGEAVTVEAVATDRPGHTGSRSVPLVIA